MECEECGEYIENPWEDGYMYNDCFYCAECYEELMYEESL